MLHSDPALSVVLSEGVRYVSKNVQTIANIVYPSLICDTSKTQSTWLRYRGCFKCGSTRCICCVVTKVSDSFMSVVTGDAYKIKHYTNCNSTHVVYLVTCNQCQVQYVGSTACSFKTRTRRHLSNVKSTYLTNISAVSAHCILAHNRDT